MSLPTRPFLAIYVIWHPGFGDGSRIAHLLYDHFRREIFSNVAGGTGLSVSFRFEPPPGGSEPADVDFDRAETNAVVALADDNLAGDSSWRSYLDRISSECDRRGFGHRLFPVTFSNTALAVAGRVQAIRWHAWNGVGDAERFLKLRSDLAHQFSKMLRQYLEHLRQPERTEGELERFLKPVRVFLSHSKHDALGKKLALAARKFIHDETELASFFDVQNIPSGLRFDDVLEHYVRVSAVVAFHTDTYSTREWCRREILEAKKANVPLVVANAIADFEERGFPFIGNVPVVRLDARSSKRRIPVLLAALMDEVLKDFLWKCRVALGRQSAPADVAFQPRPPELLTLASFEAGGDSASIDRLVYPDPPIGHEEARLFAAISPKTILQSYTEWIAEFGA